MTEKRWSFNSGVIVGTDICEEGIPHTNRSIVTNLNRYERKIRELEEENEKLKQDVLEQSEEIEILYEVKQENYDLKKWLSTVPQMEEKIKQLKKENQRMTDKLNQLALELLNYEMVTMGKATEISEMSYYHFLKYRKENGNPMELQL